MNEIDRQTKFEADALQDGIVRYCQTREYALATDSKPVRDLVADALKPLAQAILQETTRLEGSWKSETAQVCNAPAIDQPRKTRFDYSWYVVEYHQPVRI